eukprot:14746704-Alexandrium_andersonii.AAC.1
MVDSVRKHEERIAKRRARQGRVPRGRDTPTDAMLEVLCEGIAYTDRMANFFARFSDRPTGDAFRVMIDEQI